MPAGQFTLSLWTISRLPQGQSLSGRMSLTKDCQTHRSKATCFTSRQNLLFHCQTTCLLLHFASYNSCKTHQKITLIQFGRPCQTYIMYFDSKCSILLKRKALLSWWSGYIFFSHRYDHWVTGCGWNNIKLMSERRTTELRQLMRPWPITQKGWPKHPCQGSQA